MNDNAFHAEIKVVYQYVKAISFFSRFGENLNIDEPDNFIFDFKYDVLTQKKNERDHIVILELILKSKEAKEEKEENSNNHFQILVEGRYLIDESVNDKKINGIIQSISLSSLFSFLRISVFNITSLTSEHGFQLPPIKVSEIVKISSRVEKTKKKKT